MYIRNAAVYLLFTIFLFGCATGSQNSEWETKVDGKHPLVGMIWDVKAKKFISRSDLESKLVEAKYSLLGEKHDNPDHHRLQAELVSALGKKNKEVVVGFEQFDTSQSKKIEAHLEVNPWSAKGLGATVNWKASGWPEWSMYQPIAQAALDNKMRIIALNMPRSLSSKVAQRGLGVLEDNLYRQTRLGDPIPRNIRLPMVEELRAAHCYMVPDRAIERLVRVQRAKDAYMAYQAYELGRAKGAILITGAGHARKEWAIPKFIALLDPSAKVASLSFIEVKRDYDQAELYVDSQRAFDFIWFTPRLDSDDPCKKFRNQLKKFKKKKSLNKKLKKIQKSHKKKKR